VSEQPETRYVNTPDGVSLAYQVFGDGPLDLLWVPPGAFSYDLLWDEPSFAHLARRLAGFSRNIWFTPRGIGGSGGRRSELSADAEDTTPDDLSMVIDDCQCEKVTLVGPGATGARVIRFAHAHPERVASLVLIEAFAYYVREADYPIGYPASALAQMLDTTPQEWGTGAQLEAVAPSRASDPDFRNDTPASSVWGFPRMRPQRACGAQP
jgi:pimeloyl-ACP methyl ester carboxylesterase